MQPAAMQLAAPGSPERGSEPEMLESLVELDGRDIVELGCGAGAVTAAIARGGRKRRLIAFEVDDIQLTALQARSDLPNVSFRRGGAERIELADASTDVVCMFKSLHHVPAADLDRALGEIARILRPGGYAYFAEPVFAGPFNEVLRLFHDEQAVRAAAFAALRRAAAGPNFALAAERFYETRTHFDDFADFEQRIIHATHTEHRLDEVTLQRVREAFAAHCGADGATFLAPMRADLLQRIA